MENHEKKLVGEGTSTRKSHESLKDLMSRMRRNLCVKDQAEVVKDLYAEAERSHTVVRKETAIVYDDAMALHKCEWDPNYPEKPERYVSILSRMKELGLIERCKRLDIQKAELSDICRVHVKDLYETLKLICGTDNLEEVEKKASDYDSIYFNTETFNAAVLAAGGAITLVQEICLGNVQNGFAVVRPPGHHASCDEFNGYCFFNNVAIAAKYALAKNLAKKILIVDYDVHHGQGIQRTYYNDNNVLYFSIHRYEYGTFWPNLRESNYDYIGVGKGTGFNVNMPLNETGLGDDEYMSIVLNVLLPMATEFEPDLIIVSAGFDSTMGDEKGLMRVTPGFYGHLIKLLSGFASGKIAVCLEGGYFLPSLAEGAAMTLRALLNDPPAMLAPLKQPAETTIRTINNLKCTLRRYWSCFKHNYNEDQLQSTSDEPLHTVTVEYIPSPQTGPPYPTRNCYPLREDNSEEELTKEIAVLAADYQKLGSGNLVTYAVDVETMCLHKPPEGKQVPLENPERLTAIMKTFVEFGLDQRFVRVEPAELDASLIEEVHNSGYLSELISGTLDLKDSNDLYYTEESWKAISAAVACTIGVVDSVLSGKANAGIAIVRPPGHHAEGNRPMGFCFVNNVAVAAKYALNKKGLKKVLIVDFDVHHGNGTQNAFYESNEVLYISIHRYDCAKFYPKSTEANANQCGSNNGLGFNVNIPLNEMKIRDCDYLTIFQRVILPIAYEFNPELVLVSAGYDAGIYDPLGGYHLTPQVFGHFVNMLKPLAKGRVVLVTEGGYNVTTLGYSVAMSAKALLGDPLVPIQFQATMKGVKDAITMVIEVQKVHWGCLRVNRKLPFEAEKAQASHFGGDGDGGAK